MKPHTHFTGITYVADIPGKAITDIHRSRRHPQFSNQTAFLQTRCRCQLRGEDIFPIGVGYGDFRMAQQCQTSGGLSERAGDEDTAVS
jgi:hypothetical protein